CLRSRAHADLEAAGGLAFARERGKAVRHEACGRAGTGQRVLMELLLGSPLGLVAATAALVPLLALLVNERRSARVRGALGLESPGRGRLATAAAALGACSVLLALAAARPALRVHRPERVRTDAGAYLVLDVSRSMLATSHPGGPTRYARALAFARRLRARLADVPFGVA